MLHKGIMIEIILHNCPHCGIPTMGVGHPEGPYFEMCQDCYNYIGSPAAQQEGATMNNRIEMERRYDSYNQHRQHS